MILSSARFLRAMLEIPLALLSFIFYKVARFCVGIMLLLHMKRHPELAVAWRVLSKESLRIPMALPMVMTSGPRWNPHAMIGTVGPLLVTKEMRIQVKSADRSATAWTMVVYSFPGRKTVAHVGSLDGLDSGGWRAVALKPGRYGLAARYYGCKKEVEFPALEVDGAAIVKAHRELLSANDFYQDLRGRGGLFYKCLHYYVYPMLQFRNYLPRAFVERQYLPVGNPETEFCYGILRPGERLRLELDATVLRAFKVYLTVYNRASFPIFWYPVSESTHTALPVPVEAFYLVRIHKTVAEEVAFERKWVRVSTLAMPATGLAAVAGAN